MNPTPKTLAQQFGYPVMEPGTVLKTATDVYRTVLRIKRARLLEQGIPCGKIHAVMRNGRSVGYQFKHWHSGPKVDLT